MEQTADAVVIGGGIFGGSVAHFLTRLGFGRIVLLEKRCFAAVSTGHTGGAIRTAYSNPLTIRLAVRALEMFRDAGERLGGDCRFRQTGYLIMFNTESLGVNVEEIDGEEITVRWPELSLEHDDVGGGIFEPDSGVADGTTTTLALISSAAKRGLSVHEGVGATGIRLEGDRVVGVETEQGPIDTPVVGSLRHVPLSFF